MSEYELPPAKGGNYKERDVLIGGTMIGTSQTSSHNVVSLTAGLASLSVEMLEQAKADLEYVLRTISEKEIAQQSTIGNQATLIQVDKSDTKSLGSAERVVDVQFGVDFTQTMMNLILSELLIQIKRAGLVNTGRLSKKSSWSWYKLEEGKRTKVKRVESLSPRDALILMPNNNIYYATMANYYATHHKPQAKVRKRTTKKGKKGDVIHNYFGFLKRTVEAIRRKPQFKMYHITVMFTGKHALTKEPYAPKGTKRTGLIMVQARSRGRYRL